MRIVEIEHKPDNEIKGATVYLSYDNLREINNALY